MYRSGRTVKKLTAAFLAYLLPTTALAGPVYLLQLGSYENLQEARARWGELRNKYPSELKQFSVRFQDVNLPPDNFVVYRTQAGALQERADAERVCEKLASRGDECYVVETAMFRPDLAANDEPPLSIVNSVAPDGSVQPQSKLPDVGQSTIGSNSDVVKEPTMVRRIINPVADVPPPELPTAKTALRATTPAISELPGMDGPHTPMPPAAMSVIPPVATPLPATPIPSATTAIAKPALKIARPAMKQDAAVATAAAVSAPALPKETPFTAVPAVKAPAVSLPTTPAVAAHAPAPITPAPVAVVAPRPITPQISAPSSPAPAPAISMPAPPQMPARMAESAVAPSVATPTSVAPSLVPYSHLQGRPVSAPSPMDMSVDDGCSVQASVQNKTAPDFTRMPPPKPPVARVEKQPKKEEGSFWSAVNPFSSDEQLEKDEIIIEAPQAQSVDSGWVPGSLDPFKDPFAAAPEKDAGLAKNTMTRSITPRIEQPVVRDQGAPKAQVAAGFPPPPMPAGDGAMDTVRAQRDAAAARRAALAPVPQRVAVPAEPSVAAVPVEPVTKTETLNVLRPPAPVANIPELKRKAAGADVEVAEAVRVPLSEGRALPLAQTLSTRLPAADELKKMGSPSTTAGGKTLWAQIFYFHSQQAALAYWEAFRAKNPSFPPVRVRVTSPLNSALGQERLVALRVGPFDRSDHIHEICDEVKIQAEMKEQEMFCYPMSEVAGSAVAQFDRNRGSALTDHYEQSQVLRGGSTEPMYWVHLGSYPNQATAKENWKRLMERHKPVLDSAKPNVSVPTMSSAMEQQYRLRAGPYAMRGGADQLCAKMKASGSDCVVVFGR